VTAGLIPPWRPGAPICLSHFPLRTGAWLARWQVVGTGPGFRVFTRVWFSGGSKAKVTPGGLAPCASGTLDTPSRSAAQAAHGSSAYLDPGLAIQLLFCLLWRARADA